MNMNKYNTNMNIKGMNMNKYNMNMNIKKHEYEYK